MDVVIPCVCPPRDGQPRHDHDTVTLREKFDFRAAVAVRNAAVLARVEDDEVAVGDILAALTEAYLVHGVESWTLVDERSKRRPVDAPAVREHLLTNVGAAIIVGDAADVLYAPVILPLMMAGSNSSPPSPTNGSTSAKPPTPSRTRRRSSPSLTTSTPTDGTETTGSLHAGGSSS